MIYSRAGSRRAAPARSEDGPKIPRDTEVVVTRFEKGIAYVRRWEEMAKSTAKAKERILCTFTKM